jgi:hypothetical protein
MLGGLDRRLRRAVRHGGARLRVSAVVPGAPREDQRDDDGAGREDDAGDQAGVRDRVGEGVVRGRDQ